MAELLSYSFMRNALIAGVLVLDLRDYWYSGGPQTDGIYFPWGGSTPMAVWDCSTRA